jgi:predicted AAA+ superfamily ATPase
VAPPGGAPVYCRILSPKGRMEHQTCSRTRASDHETLPVAAPKLMVVDSGLAGHLAGITLKRCQHPNTPIGPLVENFVPGELARQLSWAEEPVHLYHYRDRDQYEVDAILEHASGDIVAIEVKAAETVRLEDFRGIQRIARRLDDRLLAGIVLYAGRQALPFCGKLRALPISALWTLTP